MIRLRYEYDQWLTILWANLVLGLHNHSYCSRNQVRSESASAKGSGEIPGNIASWSATRSKVFPQMMLHVKGMPCCKPTV